MKKMSFGAPQTSAISICFSVQLFVGGAAICRGCKHVNREGQNRSLTAPIRIDPSARRMMLI
jgi:hypothetical protein